MGSRATNLWRSNWAVLARPGAVERLAGLEHIEASTRGGHERSQFTFEFTEHLGSVGVGVGDAGLRLRFRARQSVSRPLIGDALHISSDFLRLAHHRGVPHLV